MPHKPLTIDIEAYTSVYMVTPPADGKDSAPCFVREPSFLNSPQSTDLSAYSLCHINPKPAMSECWAMSMLQGGASWPALTSPTAEPEKHQQPLNHEGDSSAVRDEDAQELSMTLSSASFTDVSGVPPVLEWTSSGLDGLLSRGTSGLDAILNATEDESDDKGNTNFTDLHVDKSDQPPSFPEHMHIEVQDCEADGDEEHSSAEVCAASDASLNPHSHNLRLNPAPAPRFEPLLGVQRTIQKAQFQPAPSAPRRRRRRNQQPRGAHVKNRPEMQEMAREGQKHWGNVVQELRKDWQEKRMWEHGESYHEQIQMCTRRHIKSQHECILRQLQIALVDQIITASEFSTSEEDSFLGWTGFQIVPEHKEEFRARVENMFATPPKENTLNNAFRRAGLVPKQCWSEAWKGKAAFFYDGTKRATYTSQPH